MRARSQVITRLAWHRDPTELAAVLELVVATPLSDQEAPVLLEEAKDLGNFHGGSIHGRGFSPWTSGGVSTVEAVLLLQGNAVVDGL